ncbi:MAG: serine/threonine-protein kinase [Isosphaeraceae bacterium]
MIEPESTRFWQAVMQSGLADAAALRACWEAIPEEKRTGEAIDRRLARQAVESGRLTLWQAQQLLAGRTNGFRIDKYVLLDRIGQGGMGRVYLARDTRLNRLVALKILAPERMNNPRSITRFQREAKLGAQLQHENLVRIYDEGEAQGIRYLVMEYIEGKTVGQMIGEQGRLPPAVAADIARQVSLGLEHACHKGLIHRDVNPWNILITAEGVAKLTDMGLAIDPSDQADNVTRDGATVGTFDYIAPEQARHSRSVDTRADIYALGCTLYHMLSGNVPFPTPSLPEKLYAHQLSEPTPLAGRVPNLPVGMDEVVRRMMMKNPADRYARPLDLARALDAFVTGEAAPEPASRAGWASPPPSGPPLDSVAPLPRANVVAVAEWDNGPEEAVAETQVATAGPSHTQGSAGSGSGGASGGTGSVFPELDLGPEPSLLDSHTRSATARSRSQTVVLPRTSPVRLGLLVLIVALAALLALLARGFLASGGLGPGAANGHGKDAPIEVLGAGEVAAEGVANLNEAIKRVGGRPGSILIGKADGPLKNRGGVNFAQGRYTLQARPLGDPRGIHFDLSGAGTGPAIRVRANCTLTIEGLTLWVDYGSSARRGEVIPAAVEIGGSVLMRNCHLIARGKPAGLRAIEFRGSKLELDGCIIEGFDEAILDYQATRGAEVTLRHCLLVPPRSDGRKPGWALHATYLAGGQSALPPPKLVLEHDTILAQGILAVDGFNAQQPIQVEAHANLLRAQNLLMCSPVEFAGGLNWAARENRYDIQSAWGVQPPGGLDTLEGAAGFAAWQDRFQDREAQPHASRVQLPTDSQPISREVAPADFVPDEYAYNAKAGIDARRVGPANARANARRPEAPEIKADPAPAEAPTPDQPAPENPAPADKAANPPAPEAPATPATAAPPAEPGPSPG